MSILNKIPIKYANFKTLTGLTQKFYPFTVPKAILMGGGVSLEDTLKTHEENLSDEFDPTKGYNVGDYCIYLNRLYRFIDNKSAGPFDETIVRVASLAKELKTNYAEHEGMLYRLRGGTAFNEGDDLNDFTFIGNYYCNTDDLAATLKNCPFKRAFTMKVECGTGTSYPSQECKSWKTGERAYRSYDRFSKKWLDWYYGGLCEMEVFDSPTVELTTAVWVKGSGGYSVTIPYNGLYFLDSAFRSISGSMPTFQMQIQKNGTMLLADGQSGISGGTMWNGTMPVRHVYGMVILSNGDVITPYMHTETAGVKISTQLRYILLRKY